ncbi:MAG: hypothetical protein V7646_7314 [Pseudonocardia sp.]
MSKVLAKGGVFVFSMNHPCFEQLWASWRTHGEYRTDCYLQEYEIDGRHGLDFHRTLSTYLNEAARSGCRIREIAEPGLECTVAADAGNEIVSTIPQSRPRRWSRADSRRGDPALPWYYCATEGAPVPTSVTRLLRSAQHPG